jgi:MoaA/NifB/PqqE/SkfB family radical SAM enzyme
LPTGKRWVEDKNFILTELFRHPEQVKQLEFLGGETLLIKEVRDILECLIEAGVADNVVLIATTNGTVIKSPWLGLAERFKQLALNVSIDGLGRYYEYIRYPARWSTLTRNIEILKKRSRTRLTAIATLQAYNALNIVDLFKYLDSIGLDFYAYPVSHPPYLSPMVLPPSGRRLAIQRLWSYAERDCLPKNRELVFGLASGLEKAGNREVFDENPHGELLELITDAGFMWTNKTFHARRVPPELLDPKVEAGTSGERRRSPACDHLRLRDVGSGAVAKRTSLPCASALRKLFPFAHNVAQIAKQSLCSVISNFE